MKTALVWQVATATAIRPETPRVKTFTFALPEWMPHRAGQHYDLRLTAEDGYQAQRSYSVASPPERRGEVDLTVERVEDGEVSTHLHEVLVAGDRLEMRGPIGGHFVWDAVRSEPLLLVAGGSGIVPLMSMLRHRLAAEANNPACLIYSSRTHADIIYERELEQLRRATAGPRIVHTLTRSQPSGWKGYSRRVDAEMLAEAVRPLGAMVQAYVCGPTLFAESVANALVSLGLSEGQIRTERFGPTGG